MEIAHKIGRIDERDLAAGLARRFASENRPRRRRPESLPREAPTRDVLELAPREPRPEDGP